MKEYIRPAFVMMIAFTLLTGLAYPLAITGIAQLAMPGQANGSLVLKDGKAIGSSLVGQNFAEDKYFHPRPSATSAADPADATKTVDSPYNGVSSTGSNLGPITEKLLDRVKGDVESLKKEGASGSIPVDAVTASASGLDPHISPENASMQVGRVAKARGLPDAQVRALLNANIEGRALGVLGEPRVNVLAVNLALDAIRP